jgi:DNA-binding response OmpR family regulator
MLDLLSKALVLSGFDVLTAVDGMDGLEKYRSVAGKFHFILTDHDMPQMNGLELVRQLRAESYEGRIIVMSGRLNVADSHRYAEFGISGFLQKPFQMSALRSLLDEKSFEEIS